MQANNRKSQFSLPAVAVIAAVAGLNRVRKVAFDKDILAVTPGLQSRFESLAKKTVAEHRTRLDDNEVKAFRLALVLQAEYIKGGAQPVPEVITATIARFTAPPTRSALLDAPQVATEPTAKAA